MTPLDDLTSAFECLWEAKVYLSRTTQSVDGDMQSKLQTVFTEVAAARDRIEKLLIELQEKRQSVPVPPAE